MKAIEINTRATESYWVPGYYYLIMNQPALAVATHKKALQQDPLSMTLALSYLAYCHGILGNKEEALSIVKQIESFHQQHPELRKDGDLCFAWWGIGDHDKAFGYLFNAIDKKEEMIGYMVNSPLYTGLHDDPRFEEVKRKMNL